MRIPSPSGLNARDAVKPLDVAVIRLPHISNFTGFHPAGAARAAGRSLCERARKLGAPDSVIRRVRRIRWRICFGCGRAVWKRRCANWRRRKRRCSGSAAGIRCSADARRPGHGERKAPVACRLGLLPTQTTFDAQKRRTQVRADRAVAGAADDRVRKSTTGGRR